MGDSDEEYERRKGRDKFRRERNDYDRRDDRRRDPRDTWEHDRSSGRAREQWSSRSRERSYREYGRRERYSPSRRDASPPHAKRMRRENWGEEGGGYPPYDMGNGGGYGGRPMHSGSGGHPHQNWGPNPSMGGNIPPQEQGGGPYNPSGGNRDGEPTQPPMLTFKQFLSQQDDNINDQDAIKKYNLYKEDFKRQQTNEFFLAHKEEEWFKSKYHPEECGKRQDEIKSALRRRCDVFVQLLSSGRADNLTCDVDRSEELVKLLDAAVIKMEGGTDFDLTILDQPDQEESGSRSRNNSESQSVDQSPDEKKRRRREDSKDKKPDEPLKLPISAEQKELMKKAQEFSKQQQAKNGTATTTPEEKKPKKKKRHRDRTEYSYESGSESESGSGSESEPEPAPPGLEDEPPPPGLDNSGEDVSIPGVSSSTEDLDKEGSKKESGEADDEKDIDTLQNEEGGDMGPPKPRALHKTCSIFLRNLAPSITKQEVEAMCKRYPGFIRVALQDPQPERHFFRRGWVTFSREVNIKEICWNLNNIRLRDCELGATLNRELKQRVRPVNGITAHKQVVKADIKVAAKVIQTLDQKWGIWDDPSEEKTDQSKEVSFSFMSKNPVLKNVTDYLVEEGSFEEEELLGQTVDEVDKESVNDVTIERDDNIIKALDKMILYLRIVHSIDYYSANEYPNEDEMPHRCGIMHARGPAPSSKITQPDVADWCSNFEDKMKVYTEHQDKLAEAEAAKLGKKDPEAEVEKFVMANTNELAKDKWLCPLSGKKFKGPEFVRKHLFNKHGEKVEEVKKEVTFFNNYLLDPKRPQLSEHPGNKQHGSGGHYGNHGGQAGFQGPPQQGMMGFQQPRPPMMYGNTPQQSYGSQGYGNREPYNDPYRRQGYGSAPRIYSHNRLSGAKSTRGRRSDPRGIIEYRDLDAPDDSDIF